MTQIRYQHCAAHPDWDLDTDHPPCLECMLSKKTEIPRKEGSRFQVIDIRCEHLVTRGNPDPGGRKRIIVLAKPESKKLEMVQ